MGFEEDNVFEEDKEALDMGYRFEEDNELVGWSASRG